MQGESTGDAKEDTAKSDPQLAQKAE